VQTKPELREYVRKQLAQDGLFGGIDAVARLIGEKPSTLRTWMRRNQFPDRALAKLTEKGVLAGTVAELKTKFEIKPARARSRSDESILETKEVREIQSLEEVFRLLDNHADRLKSSQGDFEEIVAALYRALGKKDRFVYVSFNEIPIEWLWAGWESVAEQICKAVNDGAILTYVTGKAAAESFAATEVTVPDFGQAYDRFIHWISTSCGKPADQVRLQVHHCPLDASPFFLPHSKLALFRSEKVKQYRAFISVSKGASIWLSLPLDEGFTNSLAAWLKHAGCISA